MIYHQPQSNSCQPMPKTAKSSEQSATRIYAGQELVSRVAQRRQRFIEAGVQQFGTLGYHATTVRTLTAAAGLSNRYFYESFDSMESLLVACYEVITQDYRARLSAAVARAPNKLEARLRAGVTCFFEELRNPQYARITQVEVLGISPRVDAMYIKTLGDFGAVIVGSIASFLPKERQRTMAEWELIGVALTGAAVMAGAQWVRSHYRDSIETVTEATLTIFLGTAQHLAKSRA
jgi:AcrR family transcriptional regulator